jgi:hypothetical protein
LLRHSEEMKMKKILLQSAAAAAILLGAGCSAPSATDNQAAVDNEAAGNALLADEAGAAESAPAIAPPPAAPAGSSADDAAPLTQASRIASEIQSAPDVERVPFEGGWAWRRNGQILRTSSRDGRRVSYFRPGEGAPFFVQQGEQSFAYAAGNVRRAYDRGGHPAPIAPAQRDDARRLADQSRHDHDQAQHAPAPPQQHNGDQARSDGHDRSAPDRGADNGNAAQEPAGRSHDRNAAGDRGHDRRSDDEQANRTGRRDP